MNQTDETVFRWLNDLAGRSDVVDGIIRFVIGDYLIPLMATLAVAWLWFAGRMGSSTPPSKACLRWESPSCSWRCST